MSTLKNVIADDQVAITITNQEANSAGSPLRADIMRAINRITDTMWPGVVVLPTMSTGATDGRMLRAAGIPTYGVTGFFGERDDNRAHGRDERMLVKSFYEGQIIPVYAGKNASDCARIVAEWRKLLLVRYNRNLNNYSDNRRQETRAWRDPFGLRLRASPLVPVLQGPPNLPPQVNDLTAPPTGRGCYRNSVSRGWTRFGIF